MIAYKIERSMPVSTWQYLLWSLYKANYGYSLSKRKRVIKTWELIDRFHNKEDAKNSLPLYLDDKGNVIESITFILGE